MATTKLAVLFRLQEQSLQSEWKAVSTPLTGVSTSDTDLGLILGEVPGQGGVGKEPLGSPSEAGPSVLLQG